MRNLGKLIWPLCALRVGRNLKCVYCTLYSITVKVQEEVVKPNDAMLCLCIMGWSRGYFRLKFILYLHICVNGTESFISKFYYTKCKWKDSLILLGSFKCKRGNVRIFRIQSQVHLSLRKLVYKFISSYTTETLLLVYYYLVLHQQAM